MSDLMKRLDTLYAYVCRVPHTLSPDERRKTIHEAKARIEELESKLTDAEVRISRLVLMGEDYEHMLSENNEMRAKLKNAEDHTRELEALFDLQRTRIKEAEKMWQKATGKEAIFPDLGELLSWFMGRIKQLETERDEYKQVVTDATSDALKSQALREHNDGSMLLDKWRKGGG